MRTPRLFISTIAWTAIVVVAVLVWPGNINMPGCAHHIEPSPGCLERLAAYNDRLWWTETLPRLAVFASGYVVI